MKLIKHIFEMKLSQKEMVRAKRVLALFMIPIFVLQMCSVNLFLTQVARAEEPVSLSAYSVVLDKVDEKDYTAKSWDTYQKVVKDNEVTDQDSQKDVDDATSNIEKAQKDLVKIADLAAYKKVLSDVVEKDCTADSWNTYQEVAKANVVTDQDSQKNVDDATSKIKTAQGDLIKLADLAAYRKVLSDVVEKDHTTDSWNTYQEVVKANVVTDQDSQKDVEDATSKIKTAQGDLMAVTPAAEITKEIWSVDGNKATTNNPVEKDVTYKAPQNDQVTVTFTKLPDNPGTLSIEEITLTNEQVTTLGALSNKAYDITSSMDDGTFTYDLTLPKPKDESNVQIKYAEEKSQLDDAKTIDDVNVKSDKVEASGIDHFTIFFTSGLNGPEITVTPHAYSQSDIVYVKADYLNSGHYYKLYLKPSSASEFSIGSCHSGAGDHEITAQHQLTTSSPTGTWTVELYSYGNSDSSCSGSRSSSSTWPTFTVNALNHAPVASNQSVSTNVYTAKAITLTATDADSDPLTYSVVASPSRGSLTGMAPNVTYTPTTNYYGSDSFTFKANDGKVDSNIATVSITVVDNVAPTGGSINYTDGLYTTTSVPITYTVGADLESGLNLGSGKIQRASATLTSGICGSFGSFSTIATEHDGSYADNSVVSGNCYKYQYVIADNAGNVATYASVNVAKVNTKGILVVHKIFTDSHSNNGITINVSPVSLSGTTNSSGNATFSNLNPGTYSAAAVEPTGYYQSATSCNNVSVTAGNTTNCTITDSPILGTITVTKIINGTQTNFSNFCFKLNPDPGIGQICADSVTGKAVFKNVPARTSSPYSYSVTETANTSGYSQTGNTCSNLTISNNGDSKSCTITNTRDTGSIEVSKQYDSDANGTFGGTNYGANALGFRWGVGEETPTRYMGDTVSGLVIDSYSITENKIDGYHFVGWYRNGVGGHSCNNPEGTTLPVGLSVSKNTTTEITLCNAHDSGTITVIKSLKPSNDSGRFNLKIDGDTKANGVGNGGSTGAQTVITGTHSVSETSTGYWHWDWHTWRFVWISTGDLSDYSSSIECKNGTETVETVKSEGGTGWEIQVSEGENIICTITNSKVGSIAIQKFEDSDGDGVKDANETGGQISGWKMEVYNGSGCEEQIVSSEPKTTDSNGVALFENLALGQYSVKEINVSDNWRNTTGVENCQNVTLSSAGENKTVEVGNQHLGNIIIKKETIGGDGTFNFITSSNLGSFSLTTKDNVASQEFNNQIPNETYSISETSQDGWDLTDATCTSDIQSGSIDRIQTLETTDGISPENINLRPGETVTCTFTNTKRGNIIIKKETIGGDGTFNFITSSNLGSFSLTTKDNVASQEFNNQIPNETYSISETSQDGWDLTDATCTSDIQSADIEQLQTSDVISPENINLSPGETVTCTFTNTKRGKITVIKNTEHNTDETFPFITDFAGTFNLGQNESLTSGLLIPGAYNISEGGARDKHWLFYKIECVDSTQQSTFVQDGKKVTIALAAGSNVTCTYYNDYDRGNSAGGGGGGNNNNNPFVTTGGVFGGATTGGATTPTGTVEGANTEGGQPAAGGNEGGQVLGAESQQCSGWPLWSWILLLLVALGGFNYATWNSFKEIKVLKWFWPLVWTVAGLGTWYLYDGCRTYLWFPYTTVILAAISYLSYLYKVKQISK